MDVNKAHRHVRKRTRFIRYIYIENKFLIDLGLLIFTAICLFLIYFNMNIYNKTYKEGMAFRTKDYSMKVNKSYITTRSYNGVELISNKNSFLVVEIELKTNIKKKQILERARVQLTINKNKYYYNNDYSEFLFDLGKCYQEESIPNEFTKYLLVYEIPNKYLKSKIVFKYLDDISYLKGELRPKYVNIKLNPKNIDGINNENKYKLGEEIDFKKSILQNTKMVINKAEIEDRFKIDYNFCVNKEECYRSYEYLKTDIFNVNKKTLLYLNAEINWDNNLGAAPIENVYRFLTTFGSFEYEINNEMKTQDLIVKEVKPTKLKRKNDYYIEVNNEMKKASKVNLVLKVRDEHYYYQLK